MELTPWDPWRELERIQREADRELAAVVQKLHDVVSGRDVSFVPETDIVEDRDEYRIYFSLPGVLEEDIDLTMEGEALILRGEREPPFDDKSTTPRLRQWKYGYFERHVRLPSAVDPKLVRATFDAGVLLIRIAKGAS